MKFYLIMPNNLTLYLFIYSPWLIIVLNILFYFLLRRQIKNIFKNVIRTFSNKEFKLKNPNLIEHKKSISEEHKRKIADSQKKRWEEKKSKEPK